MTKSIADTIHDAIEHHLWDGKHGDGDGDGDGPVQIFSCNAVGNYAETDEPLLFLESLGWPMSSGVAFNEFEYGPERQYARALSLTFAALIAKEEGL